MNLEFPGTFDASQQLFLRRGPMSGYPIGLEGQRPTSFPMTGLARARA